MSITDELREYADGWRDRSCHEHLLAIADHIDVQYEREAREQYDKGLNDGYDMGFASADDWDDDHADALREHGWVKLPVDGDGKPIHMGDVVIYDHDGVRTGTPETVRWIAMSETEVHISTDRTSYAMPSSLRHYHEPTVEATLQEMLEKAVGYSDAHTTVALDAIAEYAERLREMMKDAQ